MWECKFFPTFRPVVPVCIECRSQYVDGTLLTNDVTQARDEGVSIDDWAKAKIGDQRAEFVLIRKAPEPTRLSPGATFGELEPKVTDDEFFLLDVVPEVGQ